MRVAFLHARQEPTYAAIMVASVQKHMPGVEILQLTDLETPVIDGCEAVRLPWDGKEPMYFKMQHLARLDGDVLALDTDIIVQADLSPVFALPFEVAFTWRDGPIRGPNGEDITKMMPINCGVMFYRNPTFWTACTDWCRKYQVEHWCADQLAVAHNAIFYDVLRLHCENFNYTPNTRDEDVSKRLVVHYKGDRKRWMLK